MAGLDDLNRDFHPKCPACHAALDLRDYWKALFDKILEILNTGERVRISGFGSFEAKPFGGWTIKGLNGEPKPVRKRRVIRFYSSEKAKELINKTG